MNQKALWFVLALLSTGDLYAQSVAEVLRAVQERKFALAQRDSVQTSLTRHAEQTSTGAEPTTPVNNVTSDDLIKWAGGLPPFPTEANINPLGVTQKIALLNQASRALDLIKEHYVNLDQLNATQFHAEEPNLEVLPSVGDFDEANYREKLIVLASTVENLKALRWPLECNSVGLSSKVVEEPPQEPPGPQPAYEPAIPFVVGSADIEYSASSQVDVQYEPTLYAWSAGGASSSGLNGASAGVNGARGIRSEMQPSLGSAPRTFLEGKLHLYKRMLYDSHYFAPRVYLDNSQELPIHYWREFRNSQNGLSVGTFDIVDIPEASAAEVSGMESVIREWGSVPLLVWNGDWVQSQDRWYFQFENMPSSSSGGSGSSLDVGIGFLVRLQCICFPSFTEMTGNSSRKVVGYAGTAPGNVATPVDSDLVRIDLGRGLRDLNQVAYLGTRQDGFGNPIFLGSANSFRIMYEINTGNYPACLVQDKLEYDRDLEEFTGEQQEQTGWYTKAEYVIGWYKPKLRRIYGADVVVDITHISDYKKELRFFWASQVTVPPDGASSIPAIGATAFKAIVIENPTASGGFPSTNKEVQVNDDGLYWKVKSVDGNYTVTAGGTPGASDVLHRQIDALSAASVSETFTMAGASNTIETEYFVVQNDPATPPMFHRFSHNPEPKRVVMDGAREVVFTHTVFDAPLDEWGEPQVDETPRPLMKKAVYTGSDTTWSMHGAEQEWTAEGATLKFRYKWAGTSKVLETGYEWNGLIATVTKTLNAVDYQTDTHTYSPDLLQETVSLDGGPVTTYSYDGSTAAAPWTLKSIVRPGGHRTTWTITPTVSAAYTVEQPALQMQVQDGWGESHSGGTSTITKTNRWGGLVELTVHSTLGNILMAKQVGSQHTGWGEPRTVTGLRGEQVNTSYHTAGRHVGLPSSQTGTFGVTASVSSYDVQRRPVGINTGFINLTPNYTNPKAPTVNVGSEGTVSSQLNSFWEPTATSDTRPGGGSLNLELGTSTVDNRTVNLVLSASRQILGQTSGQGTRGAEEDLQIEGGNLCLVTTKYSQSNAPVDTVKVSYDAQGRVVKVESTGANGQPSVDTWMYDDVLRSIQNLPPAGGQSLPTESVLSADGITETITEGGVERFRYVQEVVNGQLVSLYQVKDDSNVVGANTWKTISSEAYNPSTGGVVEKTWDLASNTASTTTTVPGQSTTVETINGETGDSQTMTLTNGRPTAVSGTAGGVQFNLNTWTYVSERLTAISGTVGGRNSGVAFDEQGRIRLSWGPGFDKEFVYGGAPGHTVTVTDNLQGTVQTVSASAVGDFTFLGGAGLQELTATTTDSGGGITDTTINGNVSVRQGPDGSVTRKTSNGLVENFNREPDGSISSHGVGPEAATVEYAADGSITTNYGSDGNTTEQRYAANLRQHINGPNGDSRASNWINGRLKEEWHQGGVWSGAKITRNHDTKGRNSGTTVSGAGGYTYNYIDDNFGRPASVSSSGGFSGSYAYDPTSGDLNAFSRGPLITTFSRDPQGRVTGVSTVNSAGPDFSYGHGYNAKNLRSSRTASGAGSSWTGMGYDATHRLTGAHVGSRVLDYDYDARGNRTLGGSAETWTVNGIDQVTGRTLGQRGYGVQGSVAPGAKVRVFHPGAPQGEEIAVDPQTGQYSASWTVGSGFAGGGVSSVEILVRGTLEDAGTNGTDAVADEKAWVVVPAVSESFQYDGAGRLVGDSLWTYGWNARGHLISMTRKAGTMPVGTVGESIAFTCDADGRRVRKVRTISYETGSPRVEESKVLWDGWLPVMETRTVNGQSLPKRWFIWGRDVSGGWDSAGGIGGLVGIHEEGGRMLLPVDDGLGNITAVVNAANGSVVATYDYGPYGEPLGQTGEADACPFRFQSKYIDGETGHYYFGYRYYSPKLGRWLSRDPIGEAGGFNLYAYCANDPVNKHDFLGREAKLYWTDNIADSAFIGPDGKPQVNYGDWAGDGMLSRGWNAFAGGKYEIRPRSPTCDELARFFRRDSDGGWRIATTREYQDESWAQFDTELRKSMRSAGEVIDMVIRTHYGAMALVSGGMILHGGRTVGSLIAAGHEFYAGGANLASAVTGENYAASPEGAIARGLGASDNTVTGIDIVAGFGAPALAGRGAQVKMPSARPRPTFSYAGMGISSRTRSVWKEAAIHFKIWRGGKSKLLASSTKKVAAQRQDMLAQWADEAGFTGEVRYIHNATSPAGLWTPGSWQAPGGAVVMTRSAFHDAVLRPKSIFHHELGHRLLNGGDEIPATRAAIDFLERNPSIRGQPEIIGELENYLQLLR